MSKFRVSRGYPHRVFVGNNFVGTIVRAEQKDGVWVGKVNGKYFECDSFPEACSRAADFA
jgi:hypothetical protein